MLGRGRRVGLSNETLSEPWIRCEISCEELQRDLAFGEDLRGEVDLTHPASSDQGLDAEAGYLGAYTLGHVPPERGL